MNEFGLLEWSPHLDRIIRKDDIDLVGVSTQTLVERAARAGECEHAAALADYFWTEMHVIGRALYTWIDDIVRYSPTQIPGSMNWPLRTGIMRGIEAFNPGEGDLKAAGLALRYGDPEAAIAAVERMRVRWCAVHDFLVVWIQEMLSSLAEEYGEEAVLDSVRHAFENIWQPRYAVWNEMAPLERLQLSVEGMRGHLSGTGRRGDVGVVEEEDRYVMVLDPCGSCGVLRRGDPESGRSAWTVSGNERAHPWTWGRTDIGWYAVHSPIAMEYLWYERGEAPLRPLEGCDSHGPCRWFVYKDRELTPRVHARRMGFN